MFAPPKHDLPLVVLTTMDGATPDQLGRVLANHFGRWAGEEMHRFAKQSFKLENVRALTWRRAQNLIAGIAITMGAMALIANLPAATMPIKAFEAAAQRSLI